jgi:hypothetical protein
MSAEGPTWRCQGTGSDRDTVPWIEIEEEARSAAKALIPLVKKAFPGTLRPKITSNVARRCDNEWNLPRRGLQN